MRHILATAFALFLLILFSSPVLADNEAVGQIESINNSNRSFVVQGIEFHVTPSTKYKDGLNSFDDLKKGEKVEVEFQYQDGKHNATEVDLEDRQR